LDVNVHERLFNITLQTQIQVKEQRIDVQPYYLADNLSHGILLFIDRGRKLTEFKTFYND